MTIGLAVITYNRQDLLPAFAAGVEGEFVGKVVVNNGPAGACDKFLAAHPGWTVIDGENGGCCGAYNKGIAHFPDADVVVLATDDITFPPGQMAAFLADVRAHHLTHDIILGFEYGCFAYTRRGIGRVGLFDENFWPGCHSDIDHIHRRDLVGAVARTAPVKFEHEMSSTFKTKAPGVHKIMLDEGAAYFRRKWGYALGDNTTEAMWSTPFNAGGDVNAWQLESPSMRDRLKQI